MGRIFDYKISTARRAVCTCVYIQIFFVHNDFVHNVVEEPRFSIFSLEQVEPSKLFNNMKLLILIFDWDEKALIILQIMKIVWKH